MDTVRKHAHLVKTGEVLFELPYIWCVLESLDSWDGGTVFHVLDLETGEVSDQFYAAFDELDVLV